MSQKLTVNRLPSSMNKFLGRDSKWAYRAEKQLWGALVLQAARERGCTKEAPPRKALVRIDYFFPTAHRRDPDNYCGKVILDGLTQCGCIVDDDFAHVSLSTHGHVDKANPRTEICITPIWEGEA